MRPLPADVQQIINILTQDTHLKCVLIYGSFARGTYGEHSDIDLGIADQRRMTPERYSELLGKISGETFRKIDLVDLNTVHPPLSQEIFKNCQWIKKDAYVFSRILTRTLLETADYLPYKLHIQRKKIERFLK